MAHPETALSRDAPVVLIIDDDHSFCVFMAKLIRSLGYEVMTTTDPTTTALYQLSASDIVFIDILMPAMDGFEVLKTLSNQGAKCAIVLMSGSDDRLARAEIMANQLGLRLIGSCTSHFGWRTFKEFWGQNGNQPALLAFALSGNLAT